MNGEVRPEVYILLFQGFSIKQLIEAGFSRATVYRYAAKMDKVREAVTAAFKKV